MLKAIRLPSLVFIVTLTAWVVVPGTTGSNPAAAQGIRIQFGSNPSGYYNAYGRGGYGYGSGYGTGYGSPYTNYGYSSGYTGYGYGIYGQRSPSLYTYPSAAIYGYGYSPTPYLYSPGIQFHNGTFGHNYGHSSIYNPYYPYGNRRY